MVPSEALKLLARLYLDHTGRSAFNLGYRSGMGGKFFQFVLAGKGYHSDSGDKAMLWFSANWPPDLPWPQSIPKLAVPHHASPAAPADVAIASDAGFGEIDAGA